MSTATVLPFPSTTSDSLPSTALDKRKILVIEDDPMICKTLKLRLQAAGYDVITAADAIVGTSLAVKEQPNLMLLDISIPAGSGFIVAERLQKRANTSAIPFIFITASRQFGLREKAIRLGAASFFEKPYEIGELLTSIGSAMHDA